MIPQPVADTLVSAKSVSKAYPLPIQGHPWKREMTWAVRDFSLEIRRGEIVGLVGESGSGKTTVGRTLLRLGNLTRGSVSFRGSDISELTNAQLRPYRRHMQMIFQSPVVSLNPRMTVGRNVEEALLIHGIGKSRHDRQERVHALLQRVGLSTSYADRYPQQLSGGQCQRIGIARAIAVEPDFIVADEPVSALDVSIQAQVINLLLDVKDEFGLTMLFVSHDLGVVRHISDRIVVLYLGRIMEIADSDQLFSSPAHPYTKALIDAAPMPFPGSNRMKVLKGEIPSPVSPPTGCVFRTRCPIASAECASGAVASCVEIRVARSPA
ncbi:ABC transporter ATP-binding protein [Aquamicrobium defluvii]|uniref:Peptide/nickel transport system ATP-binding protein/oligopeptide transport system ATP-binding protein n=1 Tax=Aquamicrobium defluvii TaxID=69279 RepID=A0A4R6YBA9_9HYPH|nr:ABC transporter ATP-binding protein [Aquamicrobium defluvii]TDR32871.1 peptide/nickel transport system ATP-binding protein/oligopeptide transport system ATP-binding protein [Aquamicrobium defluvii]